MAGSVGDPIPTHKVGFIRCGDARAGPTFPETHFGVCSGSPTPRYGGSLR